MQSTQADIEIELVRRDEIDQRWPLVVDRVAGCLRKAPSDFSAGDVWTRCRSGAWYLFLAWRGQDVIGFSIWQFTSNGYFACILLAGHDMQAWWPVTIDVVSDIAKANDCRGLAGTGRLGLARAVQKCLPQTKIARVTYVADF